MPRSSVALPRSTSQEKLIQVVHGSEEEHKEFMRELLENDDYHVLRTAVNYMIKRKEGAG